MNDDKPVPSFRTGLTGDRTANFSRHIVGIRSSSVEADAGRRMGLGLEHGAMVGVTGMAGEEFEPQERIDVSMEVGASRSDESLEDDETGSLVKVSGGGDDMGEAVKREAVDMAGRGFVDRPSRRRRGYCRIAMGVMSRTTLHTTRLVVRRTHPHRRILGDGGVDVVFLHSSADRLSPLNGRISNFPYPPTLALTTGERLSHSLLGRIKRGRTGEIQIVSALTPRVAYRLKRGVHATDAL